MIAEQIANRLQHPGDHLAIKEGDQIALEMKLLGLPRAGYRSKSDTLLAALCPTGFEVRGRHGKMQHAPTRPFNIPERNLLRLEFMVRFGQPHALTDGLWLRAWRGGPQAGQPKIPAAVASMLARGLVEIGRDRPHRLSRPLHPRRGHVVRPSPPHWSELPLQRLT